MKKMITLISIFMATSTSWANCPQLSGTYQFATQCMKSTYSSGPTTMLIPGASSLAILNLGETLTIVQNSCDDLALQYVNQIPRTISFTKNNASISTTPNAISVKYSNNSSYLVYKTKSVITQVEGGIVFDMKKSSWGVPFDIFGSQVENTCFLQKVN